MYTMMTFNGGTKIQRLWAINATDLTIIRSFTYSGIVNTYSVFALHQSEIFIGFKGGSASLSSLDLGSFQPRTFIDLIEDSPLLISLPGDLVIATDTLTFISFAQTVSPLIVSLNFTLSLE
jgi:hypothetical protein